MKTCTHLSGDTLPYTRCTEPVERGVFCGRHAAACYEEPKYKFDKDIRRPSGIEIHAVQATRHERIDRYHRTTSNDDLGPKKQAYKTAWDEGRGQ